MPRYWIDPYWKCWLMKLWVVGKKLAIVGGKANTAAAKVIGMTPAIFTRSGMYVEPPAVMRRPTIRFAYWIGMRRWPSWMKTTATMTPSAMTGRKSFSVAPPLIQAVIPAGIVERI